VTIQTLEGDKKMPNQWTINNAGGGQDGQQLVGCHIQVSNDGLHYEFTSRNNTVLATTAESTLPAVPFWLPEFALGGGPAVWNWNIQVTAFNGPNQNTCLGRWINNDPNPAAEESGTWTAQAGSGMGEEEDNEDAASASA
jgi:hypothetical protein